MNVTAHLALIARSCAAEALAEGAAARPLAQDEDAWTSDYRLAAELIGRALTDEELALFRREYSDRLAE